MPEIITKHPDIVKQILTDAKIKCGDGTPPKILTQCPADHFCTFPTGEMCIYSTTEIGQAKQFQAADFMMNSSMILPMVIFGLIAFFIGVLAGSSLKKKR